jgi:hypothetical protein
MNAQHSAPDPEPPSEDVDCIHLSSHVSTKVLPISSEHYQKERVQGLRVRSSYVNAVESTMLIFNFKSRSSFDISNTQLANHFRHNVILSSCSKAKVSLAVRCY